VAKDAVADFKLARRSAWATVDWDEVSRLVAPVAPRLLDRAGVEPGMTVLDVATGSSGGSVAIAAALRGARVVGCDLTPELLDQARRRAEAAGVEVDWVEGDAESLPFAEDTFDRVLSAFGHMFAPRHALAGGELARVCQLEGVVAVATFAPEGPTGDMFGTFDRYVPIPDFAESPILWGSEEHVSRVLAPSGLELEFEHETMTFELPTVEALVRVYEEQFGPTVVVKEQLGERWPALRGDLAATFELWNRADDGSLVMDVRYLVTIGRKLEPLT
jgi:hypothetical protein